MSDRSTHPLNTVKSDCHLVTVRLVGAGALAMTIPEKASEVLTCARSAAGVFALVFRHSYPELKSIVGLHFGPRATDGLRAAFSAIDMTAKTATLQVEVNTIDTDPAAGDTLYITLLVRNSGANR